MSSNRRITRSDGSTIELAFTEPSDGDFHIDAEPEGLAARRRDVMEGSWAVVRQVHGARVLDAAGLAGPAGVAPEADGVVTELPGQPIAVQGADCAPLAFITDAGPIAVAHAGWRGLEAGIVDAVVSQLAERGAAVTKIIVGPVIGPECYEFGADDLESVADVLGQTVRGVTSLGLPALDMRAAITAASRSAGVDDVEFARNCTACAGDGFSHRARQDKQRHALVARIVP